MRDLYSIYHLSLKPSDFPAFKAVVTKIVDASKAEAGTLTYEYVVNEDHSAVQILERYGQGGLLPHVAQSFAPHAEAFLELAHIDALYVFGEPTAEERTKLEGFGAVFFTSFCGFTR